MKEKEILDILGKVDERFIDEANPQYKYRSKLKIEILAVAACLGVMVMAGFCLFRCAKTEDKAKFYDTNIEEVAAVYEDVLLVENISYENAIGTTVQLCYDGTDLPLNVDGWKELSVSANYEDYALTMNCTFNGETLTVNEENIEKTIQYGEIPIYIYKAETMAEYDVSYYAVFEYRNVWYELRTFSNHEECIYEILQSVLGTSNTIENANSDENDLGEMLGYDTYYVKMEETTTGFVNRKYYTEIGGLEVCIAEVFGYVVPGPDVYTKDLDGDGINELICNCIYGTGAERVYVYRNNNGVIEKGHLSYDLWDKTMFPNIVNRGSAYIQERYVAESNMFEIIYQTETSYEKIDLKNIDMFEFEAFKG